MQSATVTVRRGFGQTRRRDAWWATPFAVFIGLGAFVVYATWAAFQNAHYSFGPYLSPFYSPEIFGDSPHAWLGPKPAWWPGLLPFSPALLILPFPGLFRFTCYYYRGAYYKSFWADPPACAVGEPRKAYRGEHSFPLILQNFHRYFMWVALVFIALLTYDVLVAMWFTNPSTGTPAGAKDINAGRATTEKRPISKPSKSQPRKAASRTIHCALVMRVLVALGIEGVSSVGIDPTWVQCSRAV